VDLYGASIHRFFNKKNGIIDWGMVPFSPQSKDYVQSLPYLPVWWSPKDHDLILLASCLKFGFSGVSKMFERTSLDTSHRFMDETWDQCNKIGAGFTSDALIASCQIQSTNSNVLSTSLIDQQKSWRENISSYLFHNSFSSQARRLKMEEEDEEGGENGNSSLMTSPIMLSLHFRINELILSAMNGIDFGFTPPAIWSLPSNQMLKLPQELNSPEKWLDISMQDEFWNQKTAALIYSTAMNSIQQTNLNVINNNKLT